MKRCSNDELLYLYRQGNEEAYLELLQRVTKLIYKATYQLLNTSKNIGLEQAECMQRGLICFQECLDSYCETKNTTFTTYYYMVLHYALKNYRTHILQSYCREVSYDDLEDYEKDVVFIDEHNYRTNPLKMMDYHQILTSLQQVYKETAGMERKVIGCLMVGEDSRDMGQHLQMDARQINNAIYRIRKKIRFIGQ